MAQVTPVVVRLLSHSQPEVQLTAVKALTNLLLDADTAKVTSCSADVVTDRYCLCCIETYSCRLWLPPCCILSAHLACLAHRCYKE